jgi:hypothetical protein
VEDGLIEVAYSMLYPIELKISPLLATLTPEHRINVVEQHLVARARQVDALLGDLVALTAETGRLRQAPIVPQELCSDLRLPETVHEELLARDSALAEMLFDLQAQLRAERALPAGIAATLPGPGLANGRAVRRFHATIERTVPLGATIAVVSRGDDTLLAIDGRRAWHFPQTDDGRYAGYHPAHSAEAISSLERLRARGAGFFAVPPPSLWWLDHYRGLVEHLRVRYAQLASGADGAVFRLD